MTAFTLWCDYGAACPWCVVTRRHGRITRVHSRWATEPEAEGALAAIEGAV